jgi:hypothetical protein
MNWNAGLRRTAIVGLAVVWLTVIASTIASDSSWDPEDLGWPLLVASGIYVVFCAAVAWVIAGFRRTPAD